MVWAKFQLQGKYSNSLVDNWLQTVYFICESPSIPITNFSVGKVGKRSDFISVTWGYQWGLWKEDVGGGEGHWREDVGGELWREGLHWDLLGSDDVSSARSIKVKRLKGLLWWVFTESVKLRGMICQWRTLNEQWSCHTHTNSSNVVSSALDQFHCQWAVGTPRVELIQ